ncbi:unnamed protein product [Owenia fusiformis]|uniref:Uncharacterized protein n=1 Tax=Owenia fusiformis TaxID=6347 RepID=A0A8J1TTS8_OWEFU|nr:unnamed protein product [Owenia fusiformis]
MVLKTFLRKLTRKKHIPKTPSTTLKKCLTTWDMTLMSVGMMVGAGIYILVGVAAKEQAGPGIIISFIIAGVVSLLNAVCLAEIAARVHRAGSAYVYTYVTLGEFPAFLLGWGQVVGSVCGGALTSKTWSGYLDALLGNRIRTFTEERIGNWTSVGEPVAEMPDLIAPCVVIILCIVVSLGAKLGATVNAILAGLNCTILMFVFIVGVIYGDIKNWTLEDKGGFLPFGFAGVVTASAACVYAFAGYDVVALAVEEAKEPHKAVPRALCISLFAVALLYIATSCGMTLIVPFDEIDKSAPLPSVFATHGIHWAKVIVSVGPLFGLTTNMLGNFFGLGRLLYTMAEDGLVFPYLHWVNERTGVPVAAIMTSGGMMAVISTFFDLENIIGFSIILGLLNGLLITIGMIFLRFSPPSTHNVTASIKNTYTNGPINYESDREYLLEEHESKGSKESAEIETNENGEFQLTDSEVQDAAGTLKHSMSFIGRYFKCKPGQLVFYTVMFLLVYLPIPCAVLLYGKDVVLKDAGIASVSCIAMSLPVILAMIIIYGHHQNPEPLQFFVPFVPLVPVLSMFCNIGLIVSTGSMANFIGCSLVMGIGVIMYLAYGIRKSKENNTDRAYAHLELELDELD